MKPLVPSVSTCLALMEQYGMLANIRRHSLIVAQVAETLVRCLDLPDPAANQGIDLDLVRAGALLHDIAKTRCLDGSCRHAEEGQLICEAHGYPEIGFIVREHVILSSFTPQQYRTGRFPAREIVYYADKRVRHDRIVTLWERLDYIVERYANNSPLTEQRIRENFLTCLELEEYLFSFISFTPDQLEEHLLPFAPPEIARP